MTNLPHRNAGDTRLEHLLDHNTLHDAVDELTNNVFSAEIHDAHDHTGVPGVGAGGGGTELPAVEEENWGAVLAYGPTNGANEKWQFTASGGNTIVGGTFTVSWSGSDVGTGSTAPIAASANSTTIMTAIRDGIGWSEDEFVMRSGGGVQGWWNNPFVVEFVNGSGLWDIDVTFTLDGSSLTGSEAPYTLTATKLSDGFEPDEYGVYWAQNQRDPGTLAVLAASTVEIYGGLDPNHNTGILLHSDSGISAKADSDYGLFFRATHADGWATFRHQSGGYMHCSSTDLDLGTNGAGDVSFTNSGGTVTLTELPKGAIGRAVASASTVFTTETDATGLSVTVTVPAGRLIKVTVQAQVNNDANAGGLLGRIKEGATELNRFMAISAIAGNGTTLAHGTWIGTPSAGSHTYKATVEKSSGSGNATLIGNVSTIPAFILVEDLGAA